MTNEQIIERLRGILGLMDDGFTCFAHSDIEGLINDLTTRETAPVHPQHSAPYLRLPEACNDRRF